MAFVKLVLKLLTNHTSCLKWCFIWSNQKLRPSTVVMQRCDWLTVETHLTPGGLSSLNETQWDVMRGLRSVFSFSLKVAFWFEAWVLPHEYLMRWPSSSLGHDFSTVHITKLSVTAEWLQMNTRDLRALLCCLKHYSDTIIFHALWKSLYKNKTDLTQQIDCVSQAVFKVSVCPGLIFPNSQTVPRTFRVMWNRWKTPRIQSVWITS